MISRLVHEFEEAEDDEGEEEGVEVVNNVDDIRYGGGKPGASNKASLKLKR